MDLYAAGFNAWNQLTFDENGSGADLASDPSDITSFTRILSAETIESPISHLSATLVRADGRILAAGFLDASDAGDLCRLYHSVSTATGEPLSTQQRVTLSELAHGDTNTNSHPQTSCVKQLVSYDVGFAALLDDATVWVRGDERFPNCLGGSSDPDEDWRPGSWNKVRWLDDLPTGPVVQIAAGGYTLAALTEGGDLYCWGSRPGQKPLFEDLSNVPIPVEISGDADVADIALGDHHIIVLTRDGSVLVRGCNTNGQLGLGTDVGGPEDWVEDWKHVKGIPDGAPGDVVGVAAGPKTSFILCSTHRGTVRHRNSS